MVPDIALHTNGLGVNGMAKKSTTREFGKYIRVMTYEPQGVALVIVAPMPDGNPPEDFMREWIDLTSELKREGYCGASLEPASTLTLPLGEPHIVGDWDLHVMFRQWPEFSL